MVWHEAKMLAEHTIDPNWNQDGFSEDGKNLSGRQP